MYWSSLETVYDSKDELPLTFSCYNHSDREKIVHKLFDCPSFGWKVTWLRTCTCVYGQIISGIYTHIYICYIYAYIVRVHAHRNTFHPTVIKFTYTFLAANKTQLQHSANLLRLAEYPKTSFVMRRQSPSRVVPSLVCNHWPICIIFPTALETCAIILEKRWFHKFGWLTSCVVVLRLGTWISTIRSSNLKQ
jgi:hypothetical protein